MALRQCLKKGQDDAQNHIKLRKCNECTKVSRHIERNASYSSDDEESTSDQHGLRQGKVWLPWHGVVCVACHAMCNAIALFSMRGTSSDFLSIGSQTCFQVGVHRLG